MHIFDIVIHHDDLCSIGNIILNMSVKNKQDLKEIIAALSSSTFNNKNRWLYSRGEVLCTQQLLQEKKDCLIPLLEFVATVDARVGIANLLINSQGTDHQWVMVKFVDSPTASMNYKDLWLTLHASQPVANDVILGCNERANKSIIAGANGGGKTSYLKSIGVAVLLAQSWGVVPAAYAEQSWFSSVRTCLNPSEDLAQGLSKFMVQKQRMDSYILPYVKQAVENKEHILLLIDEPYSGTVEVEKNMRTNRFCNIIKDYDNCLMTLVTHLEEPTLLAQKTNSLFVNQHVRIDWDNDCPLRTFKICDGKDQWWFDDHEKRALFIDQSY
jgi:DNA mismatch repair ATPase MutS